MPPKVAKTPTKATKSDASEAENAVGKGPITVLTAREQSIMLQSILTVEGFPAGAQVDYKKVAERMGLSNPRSVSNAWALIKKKIADFDKKEREANGLAMEEDKPAGDGAEDDVKKEADEDEDANPTPKKRTRTGKKAAAKAGPDTPKRVRVRKGAMPPLSLNNGTDSAAATSEGESTPAVAVDDSAPAIKEEAVKSEDTKAQDVAV